MQPVFNDFNSTHSSLLQLNKLTFLFNPIKSKERVNIDDVKNIDRQYRGKNRKELIIERLLDFNKVTIELIDPNKLLSPTMCKERNIRSIEE